MTRRAKPGTPDQINKKNRDILKATVYGGGETVKKADVDAPSQMGDDMFKELTKAGKIIEPPLDLMTLLMMEENSTELRQIVDAMEINIEGFGGRLSMKPMPEDMKESKKADIQAERNKVQRWLMGLNPRVSLTMLRRQARRDRELTGNAYWELIPPARGDDMNKVVGIEHVPSHTIRIAKAGSDDPVEMKRELFDPETGESWEQTFRVRFRRYVQIRNEKKVWFKEFGDPRIMNRETGEVLPNTPANAKKIPRSKRAHCLLHMKIPSSRTPYGMPRYVGNLFSVFGSRAAEEINYNTFLNNNVPSLAVLVSGNAMLTEGTVSRINEFAQSIMKRSNNYSKFLILEAEPATEGIQNTGTAQIKIERLKNEQQSDQLFQDYDKNNASKLRRCFRLPPIFVGGADEYNRAVADTSRKLAEEQVFAPEREEMDSLLTLLIESQGYKYWRYKSFSPNVTNDEDLVELMKSVEKTGAMTPNMGRKFIADITNSEPEFYPEDTPFDPDVPFSLTMAEAVKGDGSLGGNPSTGALAPNQGQTPKPSGTEKALRKIRQLAVEGDWDAVFKVYEELDDELSAKTSYVWPEALEVED